MEIQPDDPTRSSEPVNLYYCEWNHDRADCPQTMLVLAHTPGDILTHVMRKQREENKGQLLPSEWVDVRVWALPTPAQMYQIHAASSSSVHEIDFPWAEVTRFHEEL